MFRISYTVRYDIPGFALAGDRREVLFSTIFAIEAFKTWRRADYVTNVTLDYWTCGTWQPYPTQE